MDQVGMTREGLLALHEDLCGRARELMAAKNHDYAGQDEAADPFRNFRLCEALGLCTAEAGLLVRLSDKLSRLATFAACGRLVVADESVEDTLIDVINYAVLLAGLMRDKEMRCQLSI